MRLTALTAPHRLTAALTTTHTAAATAATLTTAPPLRHHYPQRRLPQRRQSRRRTRAPASASAPDSHAASVCRAIPQVLNHMSLACGLAFGVGGELSASQPSSRTTHHAPRKRPPNPHPDPNPKTPAPAPTSHQAGACAAPGKLSANGRIGGGIDYEKIFLSAFRAEPGLCTSVAADLLRFKVLVNPTSNPNPC